ncbi:glutaminyl-peptide cyclotransferase [Natronoglycomyces albus]|uniref:Glutaminyl-peptide cyclotransferase n=1 Tax=Natronoglycomyces albus TaxID=2811108 RepID=A0A895XGA6_9ACTN|nr:glutaminyl-peptide cyclotransferase [Natronoglycomyces albus]QSB04374.1 glutaminyl-peptide cyclotransferase [Natronoglycomyces albus]
MSDRFVLPGANDGEAKGVAAIWTRRRFLTVPAIGALALAIPGESRVSRTNPLPESLGVEILDTFPHDEEAFTQGLEFHQGTLYESTGLYGESTMRIVDAYTGEILRIDRLPERVFGEGIAVVDNIVWQLTWKEGIAYKRDAETLEVLDVATYSGEGWGLCLDRDSYRLIMSDGTSTLTFRDPQTFGLLGTQTITRAGLEQHDINDLAYVNGRVWANVWKTDNIIGIDPDEGVVRSVVDASELLDEDEREQLGPDDVLNGITHVANDNTFLLTGKRWPTIYKVRFLPEHELDPEDGAAELPRR